MQKVEKTEKADPNLSLSSSSSLREIKVINTVETVDVDKLNADDLKFLLDSSHDELPQISQFTFDAFYDNQIHLNNTNYLVTLPGVSELILRKIIDCCRFIHLNFRFLATDSVDRKPFMVVPIIDDLKVDKMPVRKVNIVRSSYSGGDETDTADTADLNINEFVNFENTLENIFENTPAPQTEGGFVMRPKISKKNLSAIKRTEKNTELKQVIKLRFDYPVYCVTPTGNTYINPPDEEINIIGLQVMSLGDAIIYNDYLTSRMTPGSKLRPPIVASSINAKLSNGTYTVDEIGSLLCFEGLLLDLCFNRKFPLGKDVQPLLKVGNITIDGKPLSSDIILDKLVDDKVDLNSVLVSIHSYVKEVLLFFRSKDANILSTVAITNYTAQQKISAKPAIKPDSYVWTPEHAEIISYLSSKIGYALTTNYSVSAASELYSIGALELFYEIVLFGKDSKKVKQSMEMSTYRAQRQKFANKIAAAQIETRYQENLVKFMTAFKLGEAKLEELTAAAKKRNLIGADIVQALDPKDKNMVLDLIAQHNKKLETTDRSCPHWALLLRFRRAKTDEQSGELYIKLYDYFKLTSVKAQKPDQKSNTAQKPEWVHCKECSNVIMCPHLRDLTQMTMDRVSPEVIKTKMQSYMDDIPNGGNYYCKYCHEILFYGNLINSFMIDSDAKLFGGIADELRTQIWSEVTFIIKTMQTQAIPSVKKLVIAIVDYIYDYIFEIEKQLIKSKTNSPDDINNKKKLFINIYALAYIIHLVIYNLNTSKSQAISKDLAFNFKDINAVLKTQTPVQKLTPSDYIKYGILSILSTKNYIISQIANINPEFIKTKFIDAFKIVSAGGPATINYVNRGESIFNVLLSDPIYYYFYKINCIDGTQIVQKKTLTDAIDKIDEVLGVKLEKLTSGDGIFTKAIVPNFSSPKWKIKEFEELPDFIATGDSPYKLLDVKGDFSSLYSSAHKGYIGLSFKLFHEQMTSKIYLSLTYILQGQINIVAPEYLAYWAKLDKMLAKESLLLEYKRLLNMRTAQSFGALQYYEDLRTKKTKGHKHWQAPSRCYLPRKVSIGYLFDESGRRHNFDIYVFADGQMLTSKEIASKMASSAPAWVFQHAVDKKCSVCGQLQSAVHILSEAKIKMAIKANNTVENFFKYYTNRCPVNSMLHDWQNDSCKTCKITYSMFKSPSSPESMKYYTEFAKVYQDDLKKASESQAPAIETPKSVRSAALETTDLAISYKNWNFSFNSLLELSSKLKINKNTLVCLGATEGVEYKDILSGQYIPEEPDFKDNTVTYRIINYIQLLITEYNNLRLYSTLMTPSEELTALFANSSMQKMHYNLLATLPSITGDFFDALAYFKQSKSPKQILMFCLESFISRCLLLYNLTVTGSSAEYVKAASDLLKKFVTYLVKKVCKFDEMLTKPGIINWNVFKDTQTGQLEEVTEGNKYDSNFDENFGEETKEEFKEDKEVENENDFNDTNKVMANQFDVDLEDGQSMDDFDNELDLDTENLADRAA